MIYVIYHGGCYDGFGAAFAAWLKLRDDEATYVPFFHGDNSSWQDVEASLQVDDMVYFVDMCLPLDDLERISKKCYKVVVLDHHKTAAPMMGLHSSTEKGTLEKPDLGLECYYDNDESGATMSWRHFHQEPTPSFFLYLKDRDLWRFELPESKEVSAAIQSYPFDFRVWYDIYDEDLINSDRLKVEGAIILRFKSQMVEEVCKKAQLVLFERAPNPGGQFTVETYRIPVTNSSLFFSEIPTRALELFPEAPFALNYYRRGDGLWYYSLRSRDGGVDVSEIAKNYEGGGHKHAAGFQLRELII